MAAVRALVASRVRKALEREPAVEAFWWEALSDVTGLPVDKQGCIQQGRAMQW